MQDDPGRDGSPDGGGRGEGRSAERGRDREEGRAGPPASGAPRPVGDLVQGFLSEQGLDAEVDRQSVLEEWAEVVGERIASVTRPRSISRGTLFVEVRSSAWLMELNIMKREILEGLNRERAEDRRVDRIVFVQGGGGEEG